MSDEGGGTPQSTVTPGGVWPREGQWIVKGTPTPGGVQQESRYTNGEGALECAQEWWQGWGFFSVTCTDPTGRVVFSGQRGSSPEPGHAEAGPPTDEPGAGSGAKA